jgi:hypothetical protein
MALAKSADVPGLKKRSLYQGANMALANATDVFAVKTKELAS